MGVEVKGAGDGVVIAERGCNDLGYKTNSDIRDSRVIPVTRWEQDSIMLWTASAPLQYGALSTELLLRN